MQLAQNEMIGVYMCLCAHCINSEIEAGGTCQSHKRYLISLGRWKIFWMYWWTFERMKATNIDKTIMYNKWHSGSFSMKWAKNKLYTMICNILSKYNCFIFLQNSNLIFCNNCISCFDKAKLRSAKTMQYRNKLIVTVYCMI